MEARLTVTAPKDCVETIGDILQPRSWIRLGQEAIQLQVRLDLGNICQAGRVAGCMGGEMRVDKEKAVVGNLEADAASRSAIAAKCRVPRTFHPYCLIVRRPSPW